MGFDGRAVVVNVVATRLDPEPLLRLARVNYRPMSVEADGAGDTGKLAQFLNITPRRAGNWIRYGLSPRQADEAAILAGLHPLLIWGEEWDECSR